MGGSDEICDLICRVLAIRVHLNDGCMTCFYGIAKASSEGTTDTQIDRKT